jgi:hypothetical protein
MAEIVELTLDAGAFRASPVPGATSAVVVRKSDAGLIADGPGTPLRPGTRIGGTEAIRLGRYLVELLAASTAANARVFDPEAPARRHFAGLKWFPPNPALRVPASFEPIERPGRIVIGTSRGLEKEYYRVGVLRFAIDGTPLALTALALSAAPKPGDELFVPFRDATTGVETYEVGRYLTLPFSAPGSPCVLDFNAATNPLCNYSPYYNCPIPPRENRLAVPIRAGEMTYPKVH